MDQFNSYGEQIQKQNIEALENAQNQYKDKLKAYKESAEESLRREHRMSEELENERRKQEELRRQYEQQALAMREDMKRIKDEWERRLSEEQLECQRQVLEH